MSLSQTIDFDLDLINRYNTAGPRYTSYPTAVQFHEGFTAERYAEIARETNASGRPLSLYFHIPFCDTVCFYCACNKVVTKDRTRARPYLDRLYREMELQGELFDRSRPVTQLHWGGGTPTFISHDEMTELMQRTAEHFRLLDDDTGEYSIEIDPREVDDHTLSLLRKLGFNRISLGVQDFDERVQQAVNRVQSESLVLGVLDEARRLGFRSTSVDLIYGLPHQDRKTFGHTVDKIIQVDPARISVFNYAHLPDRFKPQRRINEADLPSPSEKLAILQQTIQQLTEAGYVYIGMDHFAKPDDELAVAQRDHTLYRNFQGYSTHSNCDLVGLGSTSVGMVGHSYSQNRHDLESYFERIDAGRLAVFRGVELDADDLLRRDVITRLICHFELAFADVEKAHGIRFTDYFAQELKALEGMQADGLLQMTGESITVLPAGRLLIRNICMTFDRYLREAKEQRFSRVI
ncbi:oxygen-independent coproporphyrinogen III oxidase [Ectothiorhodospira mobilis]|uniref:oxygen-independent coproporphyrinogen III oxidase n=1 Tax=Ectothiorhodospira mobilis TaxID=195064 RepID=UPI001EE88C8C|nr:oxygen-independent coproporphyrinogen III oxidase [Ectothiorhodospira mobilis]MCG5536555.1 oxygen-independent coproporphyrinogen III oxidase [Ectothiorhodospira mobilis]